MSLHRASKKPDWEMIPESERNIWQKVAAKTKGIVTPGNIVSVTGAVCVGVGLNEIRKGNKKRGTILLGVGRTLDLGDGTAADLTGTKSSVGEGADAIIDKGEMIIGLPTLVVAGVMPLERAMSIGAQNVTNIILTGVAKARGVEIHPSRGGKDATMADWMEIGSECLESAALDEGAEKLALTAGISADVFYHTASGLGWNATLGYAKDAFAPVE